MGSHRPLSGQVGNGRSRHGFPRDRIFRRRLFVRFERNLDDHREAAFGRGLDVESVVLAIGLRQPVADVGEADPGRDRRAAAPEALVGALGQRALGTNA